jgi:FkbM family methyltransferase
MLAGALRRAAAKFSYAAGRVEDPGLQDLLRRGLPRGAYASLGRKWLRDMRFRTVLDVGANVGDFAKAAHALFPDAAVYSFEPLPDCFAELQRAMDGVPHFKAFNVGLGAARGELEFNRSTFSPSSSFRKMSKTHEENYPWTAGGEKIRVTVATLDGLLGDLELARPALMKIDVQGYEDQVLAGAVRTCGQVDALVVEVSYETLYEGQPLFDDIHKTLVQMGFAYHGNIEQVDERLTGRPLCADAFFVRRQGKGD